MIARQILDALDTADEDLLQELDCLRTAAKKKTRYKWVAAAACVCLLGLGAWLLTKSNHPTQAQSEQKTPILQVSDPAQSTTAVPSEQETKLWEPFFNEVSKTAEGALRQDVCLFADALSEEALLSLTPSKKPEWMELSGYATFVGDGTLRRIHLSATTTLPDVCVSVTLGAEKPFYDYVSPTKPLASYWNNVEFMIYRCSWTDGSSEIFAEAEINACFYTFSLYASQETRAENETVFIQILQCFAEANIGLEELSAIHAREIPTMYDRPLTHEEALNTEPYGGYFLTQVPDGFTEESISNHVDQYNAYLSGLWTRGYDELSWRVSLFAEEDGKRLTHAEESERYDLSLYPIPRADSVPEELREVVDNPIFYAEELSPELIWSRAYKTGEQGDSNGWRLAFSVLCGDMVVEVRSKGVDPDWIYAQLSDICA